MRAVNLEYKPTRGNIKVDALIYKLGHFSTDDVGDQHFWNNPP